MDNESKLIIVLKRFFLFIVFAICSYFIVGQIVLSYEQDIGSGKYQILSDGWSLVREDGTREDIEIPGKCDAKRNELIVIENELPDDVQDNLVLCIRSSKQEMKVYIGDELRKKYTTEDTRFFGKVSAVTFVFIELYEEDAGKDIRIEVQTDSSYTGVLHEIHYGERWEIWAQFFKAHGVELAIGLIMLVLGILSVVIGSILKITYKKNIEMEYLAWAVCITAVRILSNSSFRQILFPSISVISDIGFFMLMLIPIPFIFYLNSVQKERYKSVYNIMVVLNFLDIIGCTILHVFNIVDFSDTNVIMCIVAGASVLVLLITLVRDTIIGKIKEYKLVALGILTVSAASVIQIIIYFKWTSQFRGSVMAMGMVFVLVISFINTVHNILNMEKEKQQAVISNETKGKFLANMSHEIRTPINAVLGMNAMILRECQDENIREYAMNIQNAGQNLLVLINDILDISKIESGKMEIVPVEYDFSSLIHDVVTMNMMRAEDKGLTMKVSVEKSLPFKLFGDEVRLRQILINLLTNAVKYTKEGSIRLSVRGDKVGEDILLKFEIEDTGIGIKPEDLQKLFARFERIEEERNRNIEGAGLGMSITIQLLKLMNSELQVESEYGVGSKFSFELKQKIVCDEPIGDFEERIKELPQQYSYDVAFVAPEAKILVVDDNDINRKVFINLVKQTKVQVEEAENGIKCLQMVRKKHYDIIFLDHMMPELDGVETIRCIKQMTNFPCENTPIIALTANAIQGSEEMYLKEGFNEFLSKPIQPEKLERMIKKWLPKELILTENEMKEENTKEKLPEVEGLDLQIAFTNLLNEDLFLQTINDLYSIMNGEADFLQSCYEKIDEEGMLESYRIKVHSMKSSTAIVGIMGLSEQARVLEMAAKDGDKQFICENTETFLDKWRSYKEKLSVYIHYSEK